MTTQRNCVGKKPRSYKIMKMRMFATSAKMKPDTEHIRGLSLATVKRTTVHVIRQPLSHELHELGHDVLYQALYILYIHLYCSYVENCNE
jgi:hypothetical protein